MLVKKIEIEIESVCIAARLILLGANLVRHDVGANIVHNRLVLGHAHALLVIAVLPTELVSIKHNTHQLMVSTHECICGTHVAVIACMQFAFGNLHVC